MVLQMCSMALRMTGSLVSSTWCLQGTQTKEFVRRRHFFFFLHESNNSHSLLLDEHLHDGFADFHPHAVLLKHVQERQEALLRRTDVRIYGTVEEGGGGSLTTFSFQSAHHGEEDGEVVEVGEDLPDD